MNDNKVIKYNAFAIIWCMCEVGMFIGGIVAAIMTKQPMWLALTFLSGAMLVGGV